MESVNDAKRQLNKQMQEMHNNIANLTSENERTKRELYTQKEINA